MNLCKVKKKGKECEDLKEKYNSHLIGDNITLRSYEYSDELDEAIDEAIKSTHLLEKRHKKTIRDIELVVQNKDVSNEDLRTLREDLYGNRKLTSDYFGTSGSMKNDEGRLKIMLF